MSIIIYVESYGIFSTSEFYIPDHTLQNTHKGFLGYYHTTDIDSCSRILVYI